MKSHFDSSNGRVRGYNAKKENEEKINTILLGALGALIQKGFANTTIEHIARASSVSRGLLHYYFESKEDLMVQAVSLGSGALLSSAIGRISHAKSTEHLADIMIEVLRQTAEQHSALTALLVEVWAETRRSPKLRVAFEVGFKEATEKLASLLTPYISAYSSPRNSRPIEVTSRILLGLYQGLVIQLISQPDLLKDSQFRNSLRSLVIHALCDVPTQSSD